MDQQKLNDWILETGVLVLVAKGQRFIDQEDATPETAMQALFKDLMCGPMEREGMAALLSYITIGALTDEGEPADEPEG